MRKTFRWLAMASVLLLATVGLALTGCTGPSWQAEHSHGDRHSHGDEDHAHTNAPSRVIPDGAGAPLFNDLGQFHRGITTNSELAQKYFDQGMILAYGFNHAEAGRSFREASAQDPSCAMCYWGEAYVLGPNINKPMDDADVPEAWEASRKALGLIDRVTSVEKALVQALAKRYAERPVEDRSSLDLAYLGAMRNVAIRFPEDLDVQTLFAEAAMDTMPWNYYENPDTPKPLTRELVSALEFVMEQDPKHIGALHLYIHAVEPSSSPDRGEGPADRLGPLSPGAGHLVHMPSHIYLRVGRYHDASVANEKAAAADESYITQCRAQGFYPAAYYPHNVHFLYASAAFEGRSEVSIAAARKLTANMTPEIIAEVPIVEEFVPMELYALTRFGKWNEILAAPAPLAEWRYTTGVWYFVRGMAYGDLGQLEDAKLQLDTLEAIAAEPELAEMTFASGSTPYQLLTIGARVLRSRILAAEGDWQAAVAPLEEAVAMQDALPYTEPPPFYFPTREALGHVLIRAGKPAQAEGVYRRQLEYTPRNGWSLRGLADSLEAQGKTDEAQEVEALFQQVFERADITLDASVI